MNSGTYLKSNQQNILRSLWSVKIGLLLIALFGFSACSTDSSELETQLPEDISFNFDIRPILSDNCYICHGPDSSSRQAGLRLDMREFAIGRLEEGRRAIVPGNWKKSEIIHRVSSSDPQIMMPPPEMKRQLSEREVALLKKWINEGAKWEPYWAFIPPERPTIPEVDEGQYIDNEIDNFIVSKLQASGMTPANRADKHSLARRLSFTLTGLPPTEDVLNEFIADNSVTAYESLVDKYLASPRFGEQWARHWMDLVRYADTRGHEFDYTIIGAWRFRDYPD